jgi:leucyl-tRNA synthetase
MTPDANHQTCWCHVCNAATPHEQIKTDRTWHWRCQTCATLDTAQAALRFTDETASFNEALDGMNGPGQFKRASACAKEKILTEEKE